MMVVFTNRAREQIQRRFAFSVDHFGQKVAERTFHRLDSFIHGTLARHPDTAGTRHPVRDFHEAWVPRTPFFVIYGIDQTAQVVTVLGIYHHAQDRSAVDAE